MNAENDPVIETTGCDRISHFSPRGRGDIRERRPQMFTFHSEDACVLMVQSYRVISSRS